MVPIRCSLLAAPVLLALLSGCCPKDYTVTFAVADVINAPGDESTREPLEVDILLLTPAENDKMPEIVQGALRSDEWFRMRNQDDPKLAAIPQNQILALRRGGEGDLRDRLVGGVLLSKMDRANEPDVRVAFEHPDPCAEGSAIVLYGRFNTMSGPAREAPLVIRPLAGWNENTDLVINVGRTGMSCANCP